MAEGCTGSRREKAEPEAKWPEVADVIDKGVQWPAGSAASLPVETGSGGPDETGSGASADGDPAASGRVPSRSVPDVAGPRGGPEATCLATGCSGPEGGLVAKDAWAREGTGLPSKL